MLYLLDSDAIIDYLNRRPSAVTLIDSLRDTGHTLCTCAVVVSEVYAGILPESGSAERARLLLDATEFLPTDIQAAQQAGAWRYRFARQRVQLATPDSLIAATALQHGATILTGNARHFPMSEIDMHRLEH